MVASVTTAILVMSLTACIPSDPVSSSGEGEIEAPSLEYLGDPIRIAVDPDLPLAVAVPGLGRITGPSGAFSTAGQIVVRQLAADSPEGSFVTAGGPGVDVSFESTQLVSPLTVFFDDPSVVSTVPDGALPLVLHRPDGAPWEARALDYTPDGIPYIVTDDFSPNVLSWIGMPKWVTDIPDNVNNWIVGTTRQRECVGGAPDWASLTTPSYLVHTCIISNTDAASGAVRAEMQVQSNRQFYQWVTVPEGNDYLWVADQPDLARQLFGQITGHDWTREVLVEGDAWFTAGYRQTSQYEEREFRAYSDGWSATLDVFKEVLGLAPTDKGGWAGIVVVAVSCSEFSLATEAADYLGCAIQKAAENLAKPDTAFAAAMSVFGDSSYAQAYSDKLQSLSSRLQWLGKAVKVLGIVVLSHTILLRVLNWITAANDSTVGTFRLSTTAAPAAAAPPVDPAPAPQAPELPDAPAPDPAPAPAPPPSTAWSVSLTRSGDTITYRWVNMPAGMWSQVDRFRCWRYTEQTHPGGWASDGCGQQTGYAGFPAGTGQVSFTYPGANDTFSVEPWKYGPWLNVGESCGGDASSNNC